MSYNFLKVFAKLLKFPSNLSNSCHSFTMFRKIFSKFSKKFFNFLERFFVVIPKIFNNCPAFYKSILHCLNSVKIFL